MDIVLIALGLLILFFTFFDFFHTTLSGNGFWYISAGVNEALSKVILQNKSRSFFDYSGLIHLLFTVLVWLILLVLGTFIIFISSEMMVVNGESKMPASFIERFYYTCFLLSTLGIGDFVPGNRLSQVLSGLLSFSGFILLTTALTYLLSVVNSVLNKKKLALGISTFGQDLWQLYEYFRNSEENSLNGKSNDLRSAILMNSSNFLAFPIINHFMTRNRDRATEVQLAALYEVLMVFGDEYPEGSWQRAEIKVILNALEAYLNLGLESEEDFDFNPDRLAELRLFWSVRGKNYTNNPWRDRVINASLKSAGWSWEEVYRLKEP